MKAGGGKRKGNIFENYVKDTIQRTVDPTNEVTLCRKTFASGATDDDKGDVIIGEYMIECKHYKKVYPMHLRDWWSKIVEEAEGGNKIPVLVYKENKVGEKVQLILNGEVTIITWGMFLEILKLKYGGDNDGKDRIKD